jgi:hypothetical protein
MIATKNKEDISLSKMQFAVYSCIAYFDVFNYPLKPQQVFEFLNFKTDQSQVNKILNELIELKLLSESDGFYYLEKGNSDFVSKRIASEKRFLEKQKTIKRYANFISRFPFVESVCISGSCSKGLLDKDGDVDYFIITAPQKLWLCRSILIAFKKIFLFNSRKYFCINYLVDSNNLQIPDENVFVATEIKTLVPVSNKKQFENFLNANNWTNSFLVNRSKYEAAFLNENPTKKYLFRVVELALNGKLGDRLEKKCFELTLSSWEKKFPDFSKEEFDLNLRSRKNVSKHHPRGFQQKVLLELNKRLKKVKTFSQ